MNRIRLSLVLLSLGILIVLALIAHRSPTSATRVHSPLEAMDYEPARPLEMPSAESTREESQRLDPLGTSDDVQVLPGEVLPGFVAFVAIGDGSVLAGSRWGFRSSSAGELFSEADENGVISLPPAMWTITHCPDEVAAALPREFRVLPRERTLVRAAPFESISFRVIDLDGPLEAAFVEFAGAEALAEITTPYSAPRGKLTDADGMASFERVPLALLGRAVATKPGYHPTRQAFVAHEGKSDRSPCFNTATILMCRAGDPGSILLRCVDDRMMACASLRLRAVFELADWADVSPTSLGSTDARGELRADGWLATARGVETADPEERAVYPCRYTWAETLEPGSTLHLRLPRRAPGRLELGESMNDEEIAVRVSDPGKSDSGVTLLPQWLTLTVADGSVPLDLPMLAEATVSVMDQNGRTWNKVVVAEQSDWQERVDWRDPDQTLTLVAHGGQIDTVTNLDGAPIQFVHQNEARTTIRSSSQVSSVVVSSIQRQRVSLSRTRPCPDDILDVSFDPLVLASFEVRDCSGAVVPDVTIRFRQLLAPKPRVSRGGCWRQDSQSVFRTTTGADGVIQWWMPAGDYEVKAMQPPWRESLDFGHLVQSPPGGTVSIGPRSTTITLVVSRPRRLVARWAENALAEVPSRWSLFDSELDQWQVFQGHEAVIWITEEARRLVVRGDKGTALETLAVPPGAGDVEILLGNQ